MSSRSVMKLSWKQLTRLHSNFPCTGLISKFHSDATETPVVPLSLHDPDYFFIVPEGGSALKLLEPSMPTLDINLIKEYINRLNESMTKLSGKLLHRASEVDLILISSQALQTAKEMPNRFNNYLVSYDGIISFERMAPVQKMKTNVQDALGKLSTLSNKLPISDLQERWGVVKGKLPAWQSTIATKLQEFQDSINKRINPKKTD